MALRWRDEGAQIIGGCCGVRPEHIAAAREPAGGHRRPATSDRPSGARRGSTARARRARRRARPWTDRRGRPLYPLPFPDLGVEPGVAPPGAASLHGLALPLRARASARTSAASTSAAAPGILGVQLALNGAAHVHAHRHRRARGAQHARPTPSATASPTASPRETVDLYPWVPEERYEVDRRQPRPDARSIPFAARRRATGRSTTGGAASLDQLIAKLPDALAPEGVAYVVQLSILSQRRTAELLAAGGFVAAGRRLHALPVPARARGAAGRRSSASRSSATPTT